MTRCLWRITRGPRIGEDIVAWCEEQASEAVTEHVTAGLMAIADGDEASDAPLPGDLIVVRYLVPDATVDDPMLERPLENLIEDFVYRFLNLNDKVEDKDRHRVENLRRLLSEQVARIDAALGE
jgi:hypothetical protein